jgi:hypothetical protein
MPGTGYLPYTEDSFFKSRVDGAPVDGNATDAFRSFMKSHPDQRGIPHPRVNGVGSNKWGTVYAEGKASDPVWKLTGNINTRTVILKNEGFHAPEWLGQALTGTSDSPFGVMDLASGFTVFGTNAKVVAPRTIQVGSSGITWHTSNGLNFKNLKSNDNRNFTSRGRISDAMWIRRDRYDAAKDTGAGLGHVLHLFLVETSTAAGYCHPMTGAEGGKYGWGAEGVRIAIAPGVNLTNRGLSDTGLVIARTLKQHGCYIGDNSGSSSALKAEQASSVHNPWVGTDITQNCLEGITWDDFVVLPKGWQ